METVEVSTSGVSAVTRTLSVAAPISSVTSIVILSETRSSICGRTDFLNPGASTVREYGPGTRKGNRKSPLALLTALVRTLVAVFSQVTAADTITPPVRSVILPRIVPRVSWDQTGIWTDSRMVSQIILENRMTPSNQSEPTR